MLNTKSFVAVDFGAGSLKLAEFEVNEAGGLALKQFAIKSLGLEGSQEAKREEVVLKAKNVEVTKERDLGKGLAEDQTTIKNWLDSIKPGDFGKIERGKEPGQDE